MALNPRKQAEGKWRALGARRGRGTPDVLISAAGGLRPTELGAASEPALTRALFSAAVAFMLFRRTIDTQGCITHAVYPK
jgi:hypothetical protein